MSKTTRYKELTVIVFGQFHSNMPSVGRATLTNINCNI